MSKIYICKIDHQVFSCENDLIEHMVSSHTSNDLSNGSSIDLLKQFQLAFPFSEIHITDMTSSPYGEFQISMKWEQWNAHFEFFIGEQKEFSYERPQYDSADEATSFYQQFLFSKDHIVHQIKNIYAPTEVVVEQMYDGDYHSGAPGILFSFIKNNKTYSGHFELNADPHLFAKSFRGNFENVFEGDVSSGRESYNEYLVDSVPISSILSRAKRVRIEVLEEKDV